MTPLYFRSIWISDTHLGGRNLQSSKLLRFLQTTDSDYLYLVGDILDLWKLKRSWYWPAINSEIVAAILKKAGNGTKVVYLPGNHDDMLRSYVGNTFNNIYITDQCIHRTADGRSYLVMHGDAFDCVVNKQKWLADVGSLLYDILLVINRWYNWWRKRINRPYHSISASIKHRVKQAVNHIGDFESVLVREATRKKVDGMICGHIHHAAIKDIDGILYSNSGDWVESCTALVENSNGCIGIVDWRKASETMDMLPTKERYEDRHRNGCLAPSN